MEAFRWTNDPEEASGIVEGYTNCLKYGRLELTAIPSDEAISMTTLVKEENIVIDENAMLEIHYFVWQSVAQKFAFAPPDSGDVLASYVIRDPQMAVSLIFGWTVDEEMQIKIVDEFRQHVHNSILSRKGLSQHVSTPEDTQPSQSDIADPTLERTHQAKPVSWQQHDDLQSPPSEKNWTRTKYSRHRRMLGRQWQCKQAERRLATSKFSTPCLLNQSRSSYQVLAGC
jgi:hypothetical protein